MSSSAEKIFDEFCTLLGEELCDKPLGYISDIYLQKNCPPFFHCCGAFCPPNPQFFPNLLGKEFSGTELTAIISSLHKRNQERNTSGEAMKDFAFDIRLNNREWRMRAHVSDTNSGKAICLRLHPKIIPDLDDLDLPLPLGNLITENPSGLVIISGTTGSGKSTTMAALIRRYAECGYGHIATLEDPIEFIFDFPERLITQQHVGRHVPSWEDGIRDALRDKVSLLMIGELRSPESVRAAIQAAASGHIVLTTAHFIHSERVLQYLQSMFPHDERDMIKETIAEHLLAVCCQALLPGVDSQEQQRVWPGYEFFLNTPSISSNLKKEAFNVLPTLMDESAGCVKWQTRLDTLFQRRMITATTRKIHSRGAK